METVNLFFISALWIRILGIVLFSIVLFFSIIPFFGGIHHEGCIAGILISVPAILFFALNPFVSGLLYRFWLNGTGRILLCILMGILGTGLLLSLIFTVCMIRAACDRPQAENTVVVLGCHVRNGKPSLMLQRRLDAAVDYLNQHEDIPVIVCGGQGADESISEAQCMSEYLLSHGIPESRIYQENTSESTLENLQNAKQIITREDWLPEITIVTDAYHQFRAANIAHSIGLETSAVCAKTSWYLVPSYWIREWLGICYQFVFG